MEVHKKRHGLSNNKFYSNWRHMMHRCFNPKNDRFKDYGGRGITVSVEWQVLANFIKWCESSNYKEGLTLDRINVNGNYCKENCRWSTPKQQSNNTTRNHLLSHNGKTQNITQWSAESGINRSTLYLRIRRGWTAEKALSTTAIANSNQYTYN